MNFVNGRLQNLVLAEEILHKCSPELKKSLFVSIEDIRKLVFSDKFQEDPTTYLVNQMADRGRLARSNHEDFSRALVMGKLNNFANEISSRNCLKSIAVNRFKHHKNKKKIMKTFEKSLKTELFNEDLNSALDDLRLAIQKNDLAILVRAEKKLRLAFDIFNQAEQFQIYQSLKNE